jgi:hypothetical protein
MNYYSAFGGTLASSFPFPELRPADGRTPDWTIRRVDDAAPDVELTQSGHDDLDEGATVDLYRHAAGLRVTFSDSGTFDLTEGARNIAWYPRDESNEELARLDLLGRVLAVALHEQGLLALHASAVEVNGRAIGFLAAKGSGKSTLALALVERGGRLLTDDTLPIRVSELVAYPGVHSVRVWADSVSRFASLGEARIGLADKYTLSALPETSLAHERVRLQALYVLAPRSAEDATEKVKRTQLGAMSATFAFMRHSKLGALLAGPESHLVFDRCSELASSIPCFELEVVRDLAAVSEVAGALMVWHEP